MRLRREIDDHVRRVLCDDLLDCPTVTDVGLDERIAIAARTRDVRVVRGIARIGEQVDVDDLVIGMTHEPEPDEVRAYEARAASDQ